MEPEIISCLNNIIDNITIIEENIQGIGFYDYRTDRKRQISVVKSLAAITENCEKLPQDFKEKYAEIDWSFFDKVKKIISYSEYGISEKEVWDASKTLLLKYQKNFDKILKKEK